MGERVSSIAELELRVNCSAVDGQLKRCRRVAARENYGGTFQESRGNSRLTAR